MKPRTAVRRRPVLAENESFPSQTPTDGLWPLPQAWRWEHLGSLGSWTGGGTPSKSEPSYWRDGIIPWVSAKDMKVEVITKTVDYITPEAVSRSAAKMIEPGSVLCVMRSGILKHTFPVAVSAVPVTVNQDLRALTPREGIDARYLAHYLRFMGSRILADCSKDGTTVDSVEAKALSGFRVPVAPMEIQRRIVDRVDALFADIADGETALQRAREGLETYRKALLKAAVTGELTRAWREANPTAGTGADLLKRILAERRARWLADPRTLRKKYIEPEALDASDLPMLPEGWVWVTIGTVTECLDSQRVPVSKKERATRHGAIPYFGANGQTGWIDNFLFNEPLVLVVEDETFTGRQKDFSYIIRGKTWVNNHAHVLRPGPLVTIDYLNNALARYPFTPLTTGTTGRRKLTQLALNSAPLALPPLTEQHAICELVREKLSAASDLLEMSSTSFVDSKTLRASVLTATFKGNLVS